MNEITTIINRIKELNKLFESVDKIAPNEHSLAIVTYGDDYVLCELPMS